MKIMTAVVAVLSLVFAVGLCQAGILENFPDVKQGVGYSLADINGDNEIVSLTTVDVISWKKLSIGAGVATELDNDDAINPAATLNWKIGGLEDLGFTYPLAKYVNLEVGIYASRDLDDQHTNYGVQGSIIRIKL